MEDQTAELGKYIAKCRSKRHPAVFNTDKQPLLKKGQKNRVLVYAGCFNPPHLGHYNILRRAFEGSRDINVIAAIILPLDDNSLEAKCKRKGQSLVLSKSERAHLWRSDARFMPEWWVHSSSTDRWDRLRRRLEKAVEVDGFEIQFTAVLGPDYVARYERYDGYCWDCHETITSDAGRSSDLLKPDGSLFKLRPYFTP
ncbi:uncharacterized protein LY79DRAFT_683322 [Colletotrichum navitas]|uniref:Cytidyltransferase-like domain-containing protein n=1 Tax=Colletotrichum navitas TaxID=681940 RepID=A0AAD8QAY3_9PEZI|nr:uncharacterized protein LY79DRAFT_683322 [Colletotrichum navitas]KAK1599318.1 hypothetical protein LY79DRAFT_683322 [Colletotrichum navitas]